MMKILFLILLGLTLSNAKSFEQAFNVNTIKPKIQTQKILKSYYAVTSYDESRIYDITVRFDGYIENLKADELYKSVKKGQRLFDIYSKEIYTLKKELESTKNIKVLHDTVMEKLRLYELQSDSISSKKTAIPFYSKFDGLIIKKNIQEGSFVKAGSTLFKIADSSLMWVMAKVYQKDLSFIKEGMNVSVEIEGIDKILKAKVSKIYPKINKEDLTFDVRIDIDNSSSDIFPDMFAKVNFSKEIPSALTLPKDAVIRRDGKFYVFTKISPKEYEPQEIEAKYIGGHYQILSGLDETSEVAQNALFLLDADAVTNGSYMSEKW